MSNQNNGILVSGKITFVGAKEQINEKFAKQEIHVQTLEQYPQEHALEIWNKDFKDKVGDTGVFHINLKGKGFFTKDNQKKCKNTLQCWKWEIDQL